jgi:membrane fusion protein (multidrug efflux system)
MPDESHAKDRLKADDSTSDVERPVEKRTTKRRPKILIWAGVVAVLAMLYFGVTEVHKRIAYILEEDARIGADLVTISSRVAGWITQMPVIEGDRVQDGTVIVQVDDRESQVFLNELEAQLAGLRAEHQRLQAERNLVTSQVESRLVSEQSRAAAAGVSVSSMRPQLELATRELDRTKKLFEDKVASRRQLDQAETQIQQIDREYRIAVADLTAAKSRVAEVQADRARLDVLAADMIVLEQREAEIQARIARQRLDILDRTVKSPIGGVVDRTFVDVGEYVTPGQRLVLVHDPKRVWVEANIKETNIRSLSVGQSVDIKVDAYPGEEFKGTVQIVGSAATSQFALLPSPNPSGNFTKITQRLPIRIAIDNPEEKLRPGMMVEVKIPKSTP